MTDNKDKPRAAEGQKDYLNYLHIIGKRWWLIAGVLSICLAIGLFKSLSATPLYKATAAVQIGYPIVPTAEPTVVDWDFFQTQNEPLNSQLLAKRIVARLNLTEDFKFLGKDTRDIAERERAAMATIMGGTVIQRMKDWPIVKVSFVSSNPERAKRFANAIAEGFVDMNFERRIDTSSPAKRFLEDQLQQVKLRLVESEKSLVDFAQREQIVDLGEKASLVESNLNAANAALTATTAERIRNEQLWAHAKADTSNTLPQIQASPIIESLRHKSALQPDQTAEINRQIAAETKRIKESFRVAYESSRNMEASLQQQVEALESELLELQKRSVPYNVLKREVDTNRTMYEALLQRYREVGVPAEIGTNIISVFDRAELPRSPVSPNIRRTLTLALLVGLLLGVLCAFVVEHLKFQKVVR